MLNIILVNEGQDLLLDGWEVCNLEYRWPLVVIFVQEGDNKHLEVRVDVI